MLQLCGVLKRPLTTMEYREALGISRGQKYLDRGKLPNDMDVIVSDCCGITFVDEEESTVHYVHHSVKQYLFADNKRHSAGFDVANVDRDLGILCMTCLDFTDFKRQLAKVRHGSGTIIKPIHLGILPVAEASNISSRVAQRLLRHCRHLQNLSVQELERKTEELIGEVESSRLAPELQSRQFQFFDYARTYWIYHLTDMDAETDPQGWRLFCRCVEGNDILAHRPWKSEEQAYNGGNDTSKMLEWILNHGNCPLLQYQVKYGSHPLTEDWREKVLENAAIHDRYYFTDIIIKLGDNTSSTLDTGLLYAAREGRIESLTSLLRAGAAVNAQYTKRTALEAAAGRGHLEVVEKLLAAGADINALAAEAHGRTALGAAAGGGHLKVVEKLLAVGAKINTFTTIYSGRTTI